MQVFQKSVILLAGCLLFSVVVSCTKEPEPPEKATQTMKANHWPDEVQDIRFTSSLDGTQQPAMFYVPPGAEKGGGTPYPLAMTVHSWSIGYSEDYGIKFYKCAKAQGMIFIFPNFRGPNRNPDACLSPLDQRQL